ncbi:hypothetical protein FSP39_016719 [Pinctada imbricata]|uniref:Inositol-pentakisphosphate 2-kinase n=1 Tax=Pinctada imbricata TaxID=66713 RepID=A0AA88YNI3_PINIB|nr:hypothetical protein FSP39_016719 [Pinctada imbricata]
MEIDLQKNNNLTFSLLDQSYLPQNCVLERILSVQMLDTLDVDEIYSLYTKIKHHQVTHIEDRQRISLGSPYTSESWLQPCLESPINVNRESIEYAASAVKRFTVSKTMQDCSIMLAMQRKTVQHSCEENKHQVLTDSHGRQYIFSVCIVDLDPKPVNKIRKYHEQRCEMSKAYQETVADS